MDPIRNKKKATCTSSNKMTGNLWIYAIIGPAFQASKSKGIQVTDTLPDNHINILYTRFLPV
jgi:hypothetical protein